MSQSAPATRRPTAADDQDLLVRLLGDDVLRCPVCSAAGLASTPSGLTCSGCERSYPSRNGVVDFLEYTGSPGGDHLEGAPDTVVRGVMRTLSLPDTPEMRSTVADIYRRTFSRVPSPALSAEIRSFAERFGVVAPPVPRPPISWRSLFPRRARANRDIAVRFERHYVERVLPAGTLLCRNVRVTNTGGAPWSSHGRNPLALSYHWLTAANEMAVFDGERCRFPIDIEPGRSITAPLPIRTPRHPGRYRLQVCLVHEGRRWLTDTTLEVEVEVRAAPATTLPEGLPRTETSFDYVRDHEVALAMLGAHVDRVARGRRLRVLEVGGATSPQVGALTGADAVNIDIGAPLLELGALCYGPQSRNRLLFLCCDALHPPFDDARFDGVVMFATLHHFPEPEALLRTCRRLITDGGFVAVMCEPVADTLETAETVRDLSAGINEQVFSVEEYFALFEAAGLAFDEGQVDGGSLKVILSPRPPVPRPSG